MSNRKRSRNECLNESDIEDTDNKPPPKKQKLDENKTSDNEIYFDQNIICWCNQMKNYKENTNIPIGDYQLISKIISHSKHLNNMYSQIVNEIMSYLSSYTAYCIIKNQYQYKYADDLDVKYCCYVKPKHHDDFIFHLILYNIHFEFIHVFPIYIARNKLPFSFKGAYKKCVVSSQNGIIWMILYIEETDKIYIGKSRLIYTSNESLICDENWSFKMLSFEGKTLAEHPDIDDDDDEGFGHWFEEWFHCDYLTPFDDQLIWRNNFNQKLYSIDMNGEYVICANPGSPMDIDIFLDVLSKENMKRLFDIDTEDDVIVLYTAYYVNHFEKDIPIQDTMEFFGNIKSESKRIHTVFLRDYINKNTLSTDNVDIGACVAGFKFDMEQKRLLLVIAEQYDAEDDMDVNTGDIGQDMIYLTIALGADSNKKSVSVGKITGNFGDRELEIVLSKYNNKDNGIWNVLTKYTQDYGEVNEDGEMEEYDGIYLNQIDVKPNGNKKDIKSKEIYCWMRKRQYEERQNQHYYHDWPLPKYLNVSSIQNMTPLLLEHLDLE